MCGTATPTSNAIRSYLNEAPPTCATCVRSLSSVCSFMRLQISLTGKSLGTIAAAIRALSGVRSYMDLNNAMKCKCCMVFTSVTIVENNGKNGGLPVNFQRKQNFCRKNGRHVSSRFARGLASRAISDNSSE